MNPSERLTLTAAVAAAADIPDQPAAANPLVAWDRVKRLLRAEYGEDVFSSWFARLELDVIVDDTVHLSVPTRFLRSWIQAHYLDKILGLLAGELPGTAHIALNVRTATRPPAVRDIAPCAKTP